MKRRAFLSLVGGGIVVAAGARLGAIATRSPQTALDPWEMAGRPEYSEPRMRALSYAILAPNPHNMQPWLVDLSEPDTVVLRVDPNRLLPHTDPLNRQITVGLGCFLEVMSLAAADQGFAVEVTPFPEGSDTEALDGRPIARCRFVAGGAAADTLFAHVPNRRSLKEPYDLAKPVAQSALDRMTTAVAHGTEAFATGAEADVDALRAVTRDALLVEMNTPRTLKESVDVFRIGASEIDATPDGIDFSGPMFELMGSLGLFSREGTLDQGSTQFKQGVASVLLNAETAMAFVWQITPTNTREDQLRAGRDWVRIHLAATAEGVGLQPMSQPLQEYPEVATHYADVHARLAPQGGTVQMLARLGYAAPVPPSPRWPIEAKLIS